MIKTIVKQILLLAIIKKPANLSIKKRTVHWNSPNTGATNETGFTALPGGLRDESSTFGNLKQVGHWWSATEDDPEYENYGLTWELRYDSSSLKRSAHFYSVGLSVRCVRD